MGMIDYTLDRDVVCKKLCKANQDCFNCQKQCKFILEDSTIYCDSIDVMFHRLLEDGFWALVTEEE